MTTTVSEGWRSRVLSNALRLLRVGFVAGGLLAVAGGLIYTPAMAGRYPLHRVLGSLYILQQVRLALICAGCGSLIVGLIPGRLFALLRREIRHVVRYAVAALVAVAIARSVGPVTIVEFDPVSTVQPDNRTVVRARFPVIDVHTHWAQSRLSPDASVPVWDELGIRTIVDVGGSRFRVRRERHDKLGDRYLFFTQFVGDTAASPDGVARFVEAMGRAREEGCSGLKIWKELGLWARDDEHRIIPLDTPRLDTLWARAAELSMPVLMHTADTTALFLPFDRHNERYERLWKYPKASFHGPGYPSKETLLEQRNALFARHRDTTFIAAHMGAQSDDLAGLAAALDAHPNMYLDFSACVPYLGEQPHATRKFFIRYADRILFGTDAGAGLNTADQVRRFYQRHFEWLETDNDYMTNPGWPEAKEHRWKVHGLNLPDDVLARIYHRNAERLLGLSGADQAAGEGGGRVE